LCTGGWLSTALGGKFIVCAQGVGSVLLWEASVLVTYDGMSVWCGILCRMVMSAGVLLGVPVSNRLHIACSDGYVSCDADDQQNTSPKYSFNEP
jgi:hypothetical protein